MAGTCYEEHANRKLQCQKRTCRHWQENVENKCVILASKEPKTLQEIGDMFGVTRMRICQLEKSIIGGISAEVLKLAEPVRTSS
jgi:DNA-directed RNA polymerase sigma subunit (sigma70/sigma32)